MSAIALDPQILVPQLSGAEAFVAGLAAEAKRHRAVNHPYLRALAEDTLPDTRWAMTDFARQYIGYSKAFPRYLTSVISRLEEPAHRMALMDNLTEESGSYGEDELEELAEIGVEREWIVGVPHPELFRRYAHAMGVTGEDYESLQVQCWRDLFLATLTQGSPAEAVGALGLGTENVVSTMYVPFAQALARLDELHPRDAVFFALHTAIDDDHQETLQRIAEAYATTPEGRLNLRRGMLKALCLRASFWDWMLARALNPACADEVS